jgi:K+ transporter
MVGCIAMVAAFQDTTALGHAYGVAVMSVMFITTILAGIVMLTCYSINPVLVAAFLILFGRYMKCCTLLHVCDTFGTAHCCLQDLVLLDCLV